ncbi:MAG: type II toxin-antitoxin system RatA family toxin [Alphaproteobacteria bacterium]|jgi:coenzyme Q-binding protein COQ10|uniref:type II toxin-antitoxin system RatA family toxin n=1 Tax=Methyloceanibacter sp. TaxID=1965321 RepID=UPI0035664A12
MHVYEVKHPVAHSADDMYALVASVETYPQFLPLVEALQVTRREQDGDKPVLIATMQVGYKLIRESFTTKVTLNAETREILVEYLDGPFSHLENRWRFLPRTDGSSEIDFYIAYSFRSRMFEHVVGGLFDKAVRKYTDAFETHADAVYGRKDVMVASKEGTQQS